MDLPLCNRLFTWFGPENRKSRLDRAMYNTKCNDVGSWSLQALHRKSSDHRPIFLSSNKNDWGPRPFKFFHCWLQNEDFVQKLGKVWKDHPNSSLNQRFRALRQYARRWNSSSNGNVDAKIKSLEIEQLEADSTDANPATKKKGLQQN